MEILSCCYFPKDPFLILKNWLLPSPPAAVSYSFGHSKCTFSITNPVKVPKKVAVSLLANEESETFAFYSLVRSPS